MKKIIICLALILSLSVPASAAKTKKVVMEETIDINEVSEHKENVTTSEADMYEVTYEIEEETDYTMAMLPILITHTTTVTDQYLGYYYFTDETETVANNTSNPMGIQDTYEIKAYCKSSGSISGGLEDYASAELNAEFGYEYTKSKTITVTLNPGERLVYAPEYKKYKVTEKRTSLYPDLFPDETNIGYVWVVSGLYYFTEEI